MKITVAGLGYVGLSNAVLLAQSHDVTALDIAADRVEMVNAGRSPIQDADIKHFLAERDLVLHATTNTEQALDGADFLIIATPTNYDPRGNSFDTSSVEAVIESARRLSPTTTIIIKSTVPVGFTERLQRETGCESILFSPEFLREGKALHDNLHPSRIVVGGPSEKAGQFAGLLRDGSLEPECPILLTSPTEAEAIKLFSNTYLALRVAYFNELDTYAMAHGLEARNIIDGVGLDPRIGRYYNNPSFGYGGYCLPKDSKQLLANYHNVPQNLIKAVVDANRTRKEFIAEHVISCQPQTVGVYRLAMKSGSDNFRESAILDVVKWIRGEGIEVIIFEPDLNENHVLGCPVEPDLEHFKQRADLILANRNAPELADVGHRVFTRDLFGVD